MSSAEEVGSPDSAEGSEPEKHTDETPEKEMIGDGDKVVKPEETRCEISLIVRWILVVFGLMFVP